MFQALEEALKKVEENPMLARDLIIDLSRKAPIILDALLEAMKEEYRESFGKLVHQALKTMRAVSVEA